MGSINNSFRFGTVDSADYNLLVAGDGTFNAPERDVDTIEIPGRNGDLLIDKGRFKNITVEYTVYCYADDLETFRTQLRNFRNALSSQKGYQKLTDTFHPDEYRLGTFISGFEAEPVMFNTVAEAVLKFDCKPQRFLLSGDESITLGEWGETETYSGSIVSFEGTETTAIKSLKVNITPKQSGTGDPSPSNVRPISGWDSVEAYDDPLYGGSIVWNQLMGASTLIASGTYQGVTITNNGDGTLTLNGTATNVFRVSNYFPKAEVINHVFFITDANGKARLYNGYGINNNIQGIVTKMTTNDAMAVYAYENGTTFDGMVIKPQMFDLTKTFGEAKAEEILAMSGINGITYFKSLFPKDYYPYNGGEATTVGAVNGLETRHYTTNLPQTVYGGVLDVVSGKLVINSKYVDLGSLNWSKAWGQTTIFVTTLSDGKYGTNLVCSNYTTLTQGALADKNNALFFKNTFYGDHALAIRDDTYTDATAFNTAMNGVQLVYELATPTEIQLTPTEVETLLGTNNIWADAETVEVEVGENPNILVNPTHFTAQPVFEVEGSGTLTVNNISMIIANNGTTVIDSEMMEAYEEENGAIISRNDMVSGEFPTLKEGNNNIGTVGLTSVKVTPKWWEV